MTEKSDSTITIPGWLFGVIIGLLASAFTFVFSAGTTYRELTIVVAQLEKVMAKQEMYEKDMRTISNENRTRDEEIKEINDKLDLIISGQLTIKDRK